MHSGNVYRVVGAYPPLRRRYLLDTNFHPDIQPASATSGLPETRPERRDERAKGGGGPTFALGNFITAPGRARASPRALSRERGREKERGEKKRATVLIYGNLLTLRCQQ